MNMHLVLGQDGIVFFAFVIVTATPCGLQSGHMYCIFRTYTNVVK
jgi:hypothetical protein